MINANIQIRKVETDYGELFSKFSELVKEVMVQKELLWKCAFESQFHPDLPVRLDMAIYILWVGTIHGSL